MMIGYGIQKEQFIFPLPIFLRKSLETDSKFQNIRIWYEVEYPDPINGSILKSDIQIVNLKKSDSTNDYEQPIQNSKYLDKDVLFNIEVKFSSYRVVKDDIDKLKKAIKLLPNTIQVFLWIAYDTVKPEKLKDRYEQDLKNVIQDIGDSPIYFLYGVQSDEDMGFGVYYKGDRIL